jgi:CHASE2 domain-containing sensor protein
MSSPAKHNLFKDKDIIFSTIFVFVFIGLLKFSVVHIPHMDPISAALEDFEISDIVYQFTRDKSAEDSNSPVVIVSIGDTREQIAEQIEVINSFQPKVVALDAYFLNPRDSATDLALLSAFSHTKNLVVGGYVEEDEATKKLKLMKSFSPVEEVSHTAFVNFVGEENKTIRLFKPQLEVDGDTVNSFASEIVRLANKEKYEHLMARGKKTEMINYNKSPAQYVPVLSLDEIRADNSALAFLKDKIVIIGATNFTDLNDLHFTPMNSRMAGRSKPDMPGAFIHANTVEMILSEAYVNKIPDWVVLLISIVLTYLSVVFYIHYYVENHIWYHLVAKLYQFALIAVLLFLEIFLLNKFNLRFSDKIILIPIVLSVDLLYFYDAFVKWLHKRFGYHTYFLKGHH